MQNYNQLNGLVSVEKNEDYCGTFFKRNGIHTFTVELWVTATIDGQVSPSAVITYTFDEWCNVHEVTFHGESDDFFEFLGERGFNSFSDMDVQQFAYWVLANNFGLIEEECERFLDKKPMTVESFSCVYRGKGVTVEMLDKRVLRVNGEEVKWWLDGDVHVRGNTAQKAFENTLDKLSDNPF
jgi:hypothetical protein